MIIASVSHQIGAVAASRGMAMGGEAEVVQVQLREHLQKLAQERCQVLEELEEMQWKMLAQRESQLRSEARVDELEYELENSRASERHMLESLASQTKQLEQTKILLEEMKLELRTLRAASNSPRHGKNEAAALQTELRLALAAEEKSKRAMDGLALALKEVSTESGRLKGELEAARGESEQLSAALRSTEAEAGRMRAEAGRMRAEAERLKAEAEESVAAWLEKEAGFLECIRTCEAELEAARRDCTRAERKHRAAVDEASNLRDIVKQAIKEASVVKESLEIARRENAKLQNVLEAVRRELEEAKAREAAALQSVGDAKRMLASPAVPNEQAPQAKRMATKYPSENWRHHSAGGESGRLFDAAEYSPKQRKTASEGGWDSPARHKLRRGRF